MVLPASPRVCCRLQRVVAVGQHVLDDALGPDVDQRFEAVLKLGSKVIDRASMVWWCRWNWDTCPEVLSLAMVE